MKTKTMKKLVSVMFYPVEIGCLFVCSYGIINGITNVNLYTGLVFLPGFMASVYFLMLGYLVDYKKKVIL